MAWSFDEEYRVLSRKGVTLALREPQLLYAACAFILQLSVGAVALLWAASGAPDFRPDAASVLMIPTLCAAVVMAMTVGMALYHNAISGVLPLVLRVGAVWAGVFALWPMAVMLPGFASHVGQYGSLRELLRPFQDLAGAMLAMAWQGGLGGVAGAIVVAMLCVERRA